MEIGRLLLASGKPEAAEPHFIAAGAAPWLTVAAEYYLAEVAEGRGDLAEARERYGRFVRWWRGCDAELRPWQQEAQRRMERVNQELAISE
jgi:hypothetical protein